MESACAFADGAKGVIYIFVIKSDRKVRSSHKLQLHMETTPMEHCLYAIDNTDRPRKGDRVTVYIPKNNGNETIKTNQPLQISLNNNDNNSNKYQILEGSAINETSLHTICQGITNRSSSWNWKHQEDPNLDLNIQVRIISTCKSLRSYS